MLALFDFASIRQLPSMCVSACSRVGRSWCSVWCLVGLVEWRFFSVTLLRCFVCGQAICSVLLNAHTHREERGEMQSVKTQEII